MRDVDGKATKFPNSTSPLILTTFTYSAQRMGSSPSLEASVYYDRCLDNEWTKEEYVEFNCERFYVDRIPSSTKDTSTHLYKHELTLTSRRQILDNTLFFDAVSDNEKDTSGGDAYRSNMTSFTFGGTIEEFVSRINSSLVYCKLYDTDTKSGYKVVIDDGYATDDVKELSFEDKYITEVLQEIYNTYELNYYWVGKTCHIGDVEQEIGNVIQYGMNDALLSVDKENSENQLVDMATGYGSSDNLAYYYPNSDQYGTAVYETENCQKSDVFSVELKTLWNWNGGRYNDKMTLIKYLSGTYTKSLGIGGSATSASAWVMDRDSLDCTYVESNLETYTRDPSKQYEYTHGAEHFIKKTEITQNDANGLKFTGTVGMSYYYIKSIPQGISDQYQGYSPKWLTVHKFVKVPNVKRFKEKVAFEKWMQPKVTVKRVWRTMGSGTDISETDATEQAISEDWFIQPEPVLTNINVYTKSEGTESSYAVQQFYDYRAGRQLVPDEWEYISGDTPYKVWTELPNPYYAFEENEKEAWVELEFRIYMDNMKFDRDGTTYMDDTPHQKFSYFAEVDVEFTEDVQRVFTPGESGYNILSDNGSVSAYAESGVTFTDVDKMPAANYSYSYNATTNEWELSITGGDSAAKICVTGRNWIYPTSKLMPSIYRNSNGKERFLYALNGTHLLPGSTTEYYTFENLYTKGNPHQGVETFEDIKPTIKDIKNADGELIGEVLDVAYDENDNDLTSVSSSNSSSEEYQHPYFYIKLRKFNGDFGFDLFKHALESDTAKIEMTECQGCPACAFEIQKGTLNADTNSFFNPVKVDADGNITSGDYGSKIVSNYNDISENNQNSVTNEIWVAVKKDNSTLNVVMPNVSGNFKVKKGDKFVLTGIKMPQSYIYAAEKRLDEAIVKWMSENNSEEFNYSIKFSRIFLAENPDFAEKLNENVRLHINYNGIEHTMYVSDYTLKADSNILQEVSVELTKELGTNTADSSRIANSITNIYNNGGSGMSMEAADARYLSRRRKDTAAGSIQFNQGLTVGETEIYGINAEAEARLENVTLGEAEAYSINAQGQATLSSVTLDTFHDPAWNTAKRTLVGAEGFEMYLDELGKSHLWVDTLSVRMKALFASLEIRKISYSGGTTIFSNAGSTIKKVAPAYNAKGEKIGYKCWIAADDGTTATTNYWRPGMMALCKTFNIDSGKYENVSNRYYWRLVLFASYETLSDGKRYDYVILSDIKEFHADNKDAWPVYTMQHALAAENSEDKVLGWNADALSLLEQTTETFDIHEWAHGAAPQDDDDNGIYIGSNEKIMYGYDPSGGNDIPQADDVIVQCGDQYWWNSYGNVIVLRTAADDEAASGNTVPSIAMYHGMGAPWQTADGKSNNPYQWKRQTFLASPETVYINSNNFKWLTDDGQTYDPVTSTYRILASSTYLQKDAYGKTKTTSLTLQLVKQTGDKTEYQDLSGLSYKLTFTNGYTLSGTFGEGPTIIDLADLLKAAGFTLSDVAAFHAEYQAADKTPVVTFDLAVIQDGANGSSVSIKGSLPSKENLPTSGAAKGDGYLIDGYLWTYTGTTTTDTTHYRGFENVGQIKGDKGADGVSAIAFSTDGSLSYTTGTEGIVTDLSPTVSIYATVDGKDVASQCTVSVSATEGCTATVDHQGTYFDLSLSAIATESVTKGSETYIMSRTAGSVTLNVRYNGNDYLITVPFSVSVTKLVASIRADAESISMKVDNVADNLAATGIDITNRKIEMTADKFTLKNNSGTKNLYADSSGNLTVRGTVYADNGTFNGTVNATSGKFSGEINATSGTFNGTVNATSGTFNGTVKANELLLRAQTECGSKTAYVPLNGSFLYAHGTDQFVQLPTLGDGETRSIFYNGYVNTRVAYGFCIYIRAADGDGIVPASSGEHQAYKDYVLSGAGVIFGHGTSSGTGWYVAAFGTLE